MIHPLADQCLPQALHNLHMLDFTQVTFCKLQATSLIYHTEPIEIYFPNGSVHAMVACYLLYEEGEVKNIKGPTHPSQQQEFAFKTLICDYVVGYLQGCFYACACCFRCTLHAYRPTSC